MSEHTFTDKSEMFVKSAAGTGVSPVSGPVGAGAGFGTAATPAWLTALSQGIQRGKSKLGDVWWGTPGQNPAMTTLGRALLLGGVGYTGGRLAASLDPKKRLNPHRAGIVAALGLMPIAPLGNYHRHMYDMKESLGLNEPLVKADHVRTIDTARMSGVYKAMKKKAAALLLQDKQAMYAASGGMDMSEYGDTGAFSTFDTFLPPQRKGFGFPANYTKQQIENDPYMGPMAKAVAVDLIDNASRGKSGLITWSNIANAAVGAGIGYASGSLFGKTLDAVFGGLSPKTHKRLQQTGTVAGLLMNTGVLTR